MITTRFSLASTLSVMTALVLMTGATSQASPAVSLTGGLDDLGFQNSTWGWNFTVLEPISVTALGVLDRNEDGLANSHQVGIWDTVGDLVASVTVESGTSASLIGQFRYHDISPVTLLPGNYDIGAFYLRFDADIFLVLASGLSVDPSISFAGGRAALGGFLNPTSPSAPGGNFFGPNFLISSVPDGGGTLGLLALGFLTITVALRRVEATLSTAPSL